MKDIDQALWPGWRVVRLIGHGSFGTVYEIQREVFGEIESSALKIISIPENGSEIDDLRVEGYDDESITTRFQGYLKDIVKEYSTMSKMKGHPNVVYCDDVKYIQHEDGVGWDIYIKMELLTPIMKCLDQIENEKAVVDLGIDMCSALVLCKEQGVLHRDIKPQNIFVSKGGVFKLGDFGIAKTAEKTTGGTKIGTYKYMAPEVYNNCPYGHAADQYSLGLVMYWLLNDRRTPFSPKMATATEEGLARKRRFDGEQIPPPAHGSPQLQKIVLKACAYDPKQRFGSAEEMMEALKALKEGSIPAAFPAPSGKTGAVIGAVATEAAEDGLTTRALKDRATAAEAAEDSLTKRALKGSTDPGSAPAPSGKASAVVGAAEREKEGLECNGTLSMDGKGASAGTSDPDREEEKEKKKKPFWILIPAAAVLALILLFTTGTLSIEKRQGQPEEQAESTELEPEQETELAAPAQLDWTAWSDTLPSNVTEEDYDIEERTLYSYQTLETTSSTSKTKDGWELYDTATGNGDYGPWSDWSQTSATKTNTREVETQTQYHYRDKETTTSTSSSLAGWTLESTSTEYGDYGAWSSWSTSPVSASNTRQIERKTQYRYRDKETTQSTNPNLSGWTQTGSHVEYGSWSGNNTTTTKPSESDTLRIVDQYVSGYNYYHVCCNWYDNQYNVDSDYFGNTSNSHYHTTSTSYALSASSVPDRGGKQAYSGPSCGSNFVIWFLNGYTYTYVYQTRTATTVYEYERWGSWSSWSDTKYTQSSSRQVNDRTMYRYKDRQQTQIYHFYRWGNWSPWSGTAVADTSTRQVESATFYRYRDRVSQTTYYFKRWTDWSDYSETPVTKSDLVNVRTKTQYRYRSKER